MRTRLIINPKARQGGIDLEQVIARLRERGWNAESVETSRAGEAIDLARAAAADGCDVVVACGGDGTINEVINGLAGTEAALGVIPLGTANVWAVEMGIPRQPIEAADALVDGRIRRVDLGRAGDRYFLLMAGIGLDAEVVKAVPPALKKRLGIVAFFLHGVHKVIGFRGERSIVLVDGVPHRRWLRLAVISNTRLYGGAFTMTHQALIDDGLLDVVIFSNRNGPIGTVAQLVRLLLRRPDAKAGYDYFQARSVRIWTRHRLSVQVDGELHCETPISLRIEPLALKVLLPHPLPHGPFSDSELAETEEQPVAPALSRPGGSAE
jgi:YegS/Rv2252/BmrU family lipid kinase